MISESDTPEPFDGDSFEDDFLDRDFFEDDVLGSDTDDDSPDGDAVDPDFVERAPIESEEDAAEVVRLLLDLDDIASGALLLLLCDSDRRPIMPVLVTDLPATSSAHEVVGRWLHGVADQLDAESLGIILARARPGQSFVVDHDRAWHEAVLAACEQSSMTLLHAFVVTPHAVIPFPRPLARLVG